MAGKRPEGKELRTSKGSDDLAGVQVRRRDRARADDAITGDAAPPDPTGSAVVEGQEVTTFDPSTAFPDDSTTPDLDARESRQRTKRRSKGPQPTKAASPRTSAEVECEPASAPPPTDPA